jgi:protoporphyrinogen/coproporphyrinogen III oxidase
MTAQFEVVIVGGGIAGLAAAHRLEQVAPSARVALLEADTQVGGWIRTVTDRGFTVEAGPDSFLSAKPAGLRLAREVGLENRLEGVDESSRATYIMHNGALQPLPEGLSGLVPGHLGPLFRSSLLTPWGKLRVAVEQATRARQGADDESLGSFMRRRFGGEAYERMIEPLMSGIYGGNGDRLSLLATFPQLRRLEVEHGSVLRGIKRASGPAPAGRRPSPFVAPVEGMEALPRAVRASLTSASVETGMVVTEVRNAGQQFRVETASGAEFSSRSLIITTPAPVTASLMAGLDAGLTEIHRGIAYGSTATVSLGYAPGAVVTDGLGHGYIIPRREGRALMAVTFSSRKFRHRVPDGALLVRGFVRVGDDPELLARGDDEMIGLVREELRRTRNIVAQPEVCWVFRLPQSMPQYAVGHIDRVAEIERRLSVLPGLFVAGAAYRGVGIPDCIASGEAAADRAFTFLSGYTRSTYA